MGKLISKRYAVALFELANENNSIDSINSEVELIYNSIKDDSEFLSILDHPIISGDEKFQLFKNIFGDNISDETLGLLSIVIKKNRENQILDILDNFIDLVKSYKGIVTAIVSSAMPLTNNQSEAIKQKLSKTLNKKIILEVNVVPELIGGLLINVNGKVIDNSIKKELINIKKNLINK